MKRFIVVLVVLFHVAGASADGVFRVDFRPGDKFKLTEISDLRRYENGRFKGLSYREVRGVLGVAAGSGGRAEIAGSFFVFEETRHNARLVAKQIDDVIPVQFSIDETGVYQVPAGQGFPSLRSFPAFPARSLRTGDRWEAYGARVVEPFRDGVFTNVRFFSGYEYQGTVSRDGQTVDLITAQYALRYKDGDDPHGDPRIKAISGSHKVEIQFNETSGRPHFMRALVDETYSLADGTTLGFKGFVLTWFDGIVTMDRGEVAERLRRDLGDHLAQLPAANAERSGSGSSGGAGHDASETGAPPGAAEGTGPGFSSTRAIEGPRTTPGGPDGERDEIEGALISSGADRGVTVTVTDRGIALNLHAIRFVPDQATVLADERPRLEAVARTLEGIKDRSFLVVGHTAEAGSVEGQQLLSLERARAVVDYLVGAGIAPGRFLFEGRGATEPVATNDTPEGRALNRRVEIIVLED